MQSCAIDLRQRLFRCSYCKKIVNETREKRSRKYLVSESQGAHLYIPTHTYISCNIHATIYISLNISYVCLPRLDLTNFIHLNLLILKFCSQYFQRFSCGMALEKKFCCKNKVMIRQESLTRILRNIVGQHLASIRKLFYWRPTIEFFPFLYNIGLSPEYKVSSKRKIILRTEFEAQCNIKCTQQLYIERVASHINVQLCQLNCQLIVSFTSLLV